MFKGFITLENQADFNWERLEAAKIDTHYAHTA